MTRLLIALVALLALALIAEAVFDNPVAARASIGLLAVALVARYEFWPESSRSHQRD